MSSFYIKSDNGLKGTLMTRLSLNRESLKIKQEVASFTLTT